MDCVRAGPPKAADAELLAELLSQRASQRFAGARSGRPSPQLVS